MRAVQPVLAPAAVQPAAEPLAQHVVPEVEHPAVVAEETHPSDVTEDPQSQEKVGGPPVQKNRGRCFSCNKKVGLLGFDCKCGYVFCSAHRHAISSEKDKSSGHKCTFGWQDFDRKILADSMEVVAPKKIEKL